MGLVEQTKIILGGLEFKKRGVTEHLPNRKSTPFSLSKHSTPHILVHIVLTKCGKKDKKKLGL
jgi:23S rRNA pseudoU1915 N3-methylase RlmH